MIEVIFYSITVIPTLIICLTMWVIEDRLEKGDK